MPRRHVPPPQFRPPSVPTPWGQIIAAALILFGVLLLCDMMGSCWRDAKQTADAQRRNADDERRENERRWARENALNRADAARLAAIDAEERSLSPQDRDWRIRDILASDAGNVVCDAKRLLAKASDPKAAALRPTIAAIKAAERQQLLHERPAFEETRGLVCADGSLSPSCTCHGAHGGCCSHHGGVAGCEPYPAEVSCPLY